VEEYNLTFADNDASYGANFAGFSTFIKLTSALEEVSENIKTRYDLGNETVYMLNEAIVSGINLKEVLEIEIIDDREQVMALDNESTSVISPFYV